VSAIEPHLAGPAVDSLIIADFAQAIDGKLYVMGGGFTALHVVDFRMPSRFFFGALLTVPWEDANRHIPVEGFLETIDGEQIEGYRVHGNVETGRPPGARPGVANLVALAGPVEFTVARPTDLLFVLQFGADRKTRRFSVLPYGGPPAPPPPPPAPPRA
jgi:hypothetical protein